MQKASQPAQSGSPAPRRLSTRLKTHFRADPARVRQPKVGMFAILVSAVLLVLAALLIRAGLEKPVDVELSYTQPITAVQASNAPAGENTIELTSPGAPTGHPQADLSSGFFDFGTISRSVVVQRDFLLINHGDAPLVIHEAHTTCGCTIANLTASIIPPGQASRITMVFNAGFHNVAGQTVRRGLLMMTNDPDHPELEIWVQASVR